MNVRGGFFRFGWGGFSLYNPEGWLTTTEAPADGVELPLETTPAAPGEASPRPVVLSQAVGSSSFRDRPAQVIYIHGGEGGVAAPDPLRTAAFVALAPRPAQLDVRFQAVIVHSFVETHASPRPISVLAAVPSQVLPPQAPIIRRNTPDDVASPRPVVQLRALPDAFTATPSVMVVHGAVEAATASPLPVTVQSGQAALTARLTLQGPVVARGAFEEAASAPRPVVVPGQAIFAALTAAGAPLRALVVRGGVDLVIPPPEPAPIVIGGRELPGERRRTRRKREEEIDEEAKRTAALQATVSTIIRDEEERQREAIRTEAIDRLDRLRKNLRALRDLD